MAPAALTPKEGPQSAQAKNLKPVEIAEQKKFFERKKWQLKE